MFRIKTAKKNIMVIRNKGKNWLNKGVAMALMYRILHDLINIRVIEFIQTMRNFQSHCDTVIVPGIWINRERGVVWEIGLTNAAIVKAKTIKCKFFGGPPGSRSWYKGSLLTMLIDRVMVCALEEGMKTAGRLFPNEKILTED